MSYEMERDALWSAADDLADGANGLLVRRGDKLIVQGTLEQIRQLLAQSEEPGSAQWECVINYGAA